MSTYRCPSCGAPASEGRFCGVCGMRLPLAPIIYPAAVAPSGLQPPGAILDRRYRVIRVLASGAMGAVYLAEDVRLGNKQRALKELRQHWGTEAERAEAEAWFRREGETLMSLQHPAIPQVHDTFSHGARHYLVMDLVEGRSLEEVLAQDGDPGLPEAQIIGWADQILDVLSYLHSRPDPLIFRDLKPANVMLTPAERIRLIDFGIARVFTQQGQGTAIGTPGYAPPEQYQGFAEPASDLYALGATMHHLLTGRDPRSNRPFDFPPARSLSPRISDVVALTIDRSLVLDPRARYGTAADMRRALHATSMSGAMPRTVSGVLSRSNSAAMAAVAAKTPASPADAGQTAVSVNRRAVRLKPRELQITLAGSTVLTGLDDRTVRVHNRTRERIQCTFDADVTWLRPDPPAAVLDPKGNVRVSLGISSQKLSAGTHGGVLRINGGGQTWTVPVRLRVRGGNIVVRQRVGRTLQRVAILCLIVGLMSSALGAFGMQMMSGTTSWDLVVFGLVGTVLLGVLRAGKRP